MDIVGTQKSREDRASACRSFGSNYHPCSQSRKISIGVMVDSIPKSRAIATKENECKANLNENQINQERNSSPKKPISENIHQPKPTIDLPAGDNLKKLSRDYSVREGDEEGEREGMKVFFSENAQKFSVPEKEVGEDKAIGPEDRRQVLKLKLWEILGANSSANKEASQAPEMGGNNLIPEPEINQKCEAVVKPKQNSDTTKISGHSIKKAMTRSLTKKKAISKEPITKIRKVRKSPSTKKSLVKNIFSFNEGQFGKVYDAVTSDSPKLNEKGRKGSKGEGPMFSFPKELAPDEVEPALDFSKTIKSAKKSSSFGNVTRSFQNIPSRNTSRLVDAENGNQENGSSLSSATKRRGKGFNADEDKTTEDVEKDSSIGKRTRFYRNSPPEKCSKFIVAENGDWRKEFSPSQAKKKKANTSLLRTPHNSVQQKDFGSSFKNNMNSDEYIQSPTFEVKTPAEAFSPGSPLKASEGELNDQSPQDYIFTSPVSLKPDKSAPDAGTRTYNDDEEAEDSLISKSMPIMSEQDPEDALDVSSPEKMDSGSSKEGYKGLGREAMSPDIGTSMNPEFGLYTNKRLHSQEKFEFRHFSPILASPEGNCSSEENDGSQGPPETNEENGSANAISLLALALQRVKSKIKTVTSKKSTEVLMSVAEEVHLQLQNAESQFERDVGKLTSLNKSQRKHLETELEEQQEKLKIIYQKFKSDVSQHILEHRSKVEGLQGQERELRLFMEKRNASQKEALKQMEESIQDQLSDAEMRIADVQKMGREKILQLKQALGKCLKEGMLS